MSTLPGSLAENAVTSDVSAKRNQPAARRFYIGVGVFLILWSIAGFGPSMIDASHRNGPSSALTMVHGAVTALFLLLFLAQAFLVASGRTVVHKRLGIATAICALAVVVLGFITSIVPSAAASIFPATFRGHQPQTRRSRPPMFSSRC